MDLFQNILISSIILSFCYNLIYQWIFIKQKKFDPIKPRSSHKTLATKTGGLSIFSTIFTLSIFLYLRNNEIFDFTLLLPLAIIVVIGFYDDLYDADFKLKFIIQIIVAKLFIDNGLIINNYFGFLGFYEVPHLIAQLTTVFVFILIVNSINFIDGIDGLAITYSLFTLFSFELFSSSKFITPINLICIGSTIPLYYFNFKKKKKVFLGDAGSLFIGSLIAINSLHFLNSNQFIDSPNRVLLLLSILFYPLFDLLRVFILRLRQRKSPFIADKNHLHHLLLEKINSHAICNLIIFGFCIIMLFLMHIIL